MTLISVNDVTFRDRLHVSKITPVHRPYSDQLSRVTSLKSNICSIINGRESISSD